jgi:hypothetical protein
MSKMLRLVSVCSEFRTQQALATVAWLAVALREDEKERATPSTAGPVNLPQNFVQRII